MTHCSACGKQIAKANFCPYCGKPTQLATEQVIDERTSSMAMQQPPVNQYLSPSPPATHPAYSPALPTSVISRSSNMPAHWVAIFAGVCAASMLAAVIASLLPWISYAGIEIGGLHRDGKLVLVLGLLGIAFAIVAAVWKSRWPFSVLIVLGIVVASLILIDIVDVTRTVGLSLSNVDVGLFIGAAAGLIGVVAGAAGSSLKSSPKKGFSD